MAPSRSALLAGLVLVLTGCPSSTGLVPRLRLAGGRAWLVMDSSQGKDSSWPAGVPGSARVRTNIKFAGGSRNLRQVSTRKKSPRAKKKYEGSWWKSSRPDLGRMTALCITNEINVDMVSETVQTGLPFRRFGNEVSIVRYNEALHCQFKGTKALSPVPADEDGPAGDQAGADAWRDVFVFPYGVVVLWNFEEEEEARLVDEIAEACDPPLAKVINDVDSELMNFEIAEKASIGNDTVALTSADPVEKLAVSFAFAQSTKLAFFESALDDIVEQVRPIPLQLSETGRSAFSQEDVAILTGQVFFTRTAVNLFSDILDTPNFFWDAEQYEPLYRRANRYLDVDDRVRILNSRLDIVNDLLDNLNTQLTNRNSERLEWVIIVLIMVEVAISLVNDGPRLWARFSSLIMR
uniref:DUF155 domain-containing protein n=1 Tax=Rhizochromulina marina TaxID=1034831 RepID=A0A6U1C957_9STRA|mmetsp:Transcript_6381/g.18689  ORF Transcript_6381/g.18689 Transcript_6381/m.18689 type:complete len:407 (+) Transcript_6381:140-1360(+)